MEEKSIFFGQESIRLEGLYAHSGGDRGAVISHPHPPRGGDMLNPVVAVLSETLFVGGFSTLRFNFRGVGKSTGAYDDGRGEQDDVLAAVSFMEEQGCRDTLLAGYSFGAWVNAHILTRRNFLPAIFIAPPINLFPFDLQILRGKIGLIVCGDHDKYCPVESIKAVAAGLACHLDIIPEADHFFQSREEDIADCINNCNRQPNL